ncbi:MAG: hypothetical protein ABI670_19570 [Chloroflexota bacterium]
MAHVMRQANLFDLLSIAATRSKQRVLRLNPPYTLVQPDALFTDLVRSLLPMRPRVNFVYVYSVRGIVQGYVQARCRWQRRDEWTITTLAATDKAPDHVWERLLEEVCRAAGEEGVIRLFVKVPGDEFQLGTFRSLGFTPYTNEQMWGHLYVRSSKSDEDDDPYRKLLRRRTSGDAWDLMQLYSAVTPPVVQRAEMLTTKQWHISHIPRPWFLSQGLLEKSYVWQDESGRGEGLGGYVRLLTGASGHWVTTLYRPDPGNRAIAPAALDHVLWKAARHGNKPVYCGIREYQAEVGTLLEERGFHLLSEQALLVKYLAEPIKERQPALVPFLVNNADFVATK